MARKIIPLRETEPIFDSRGMGTRRFNEFMRVVTEVSNENTANIDAAVSMDIFSLITNIVNRIGSGDDLTWDSDSFTWDSDQFTFDMDEA